MNDQLNERFVTLMDYIGESVKNTNEFVASQSPLVAQDIIRWHFWFSVVAASLWGVLLILSIVVFVIACRFACKPHKNEDPVVISALSFVVGVVCFIGLTVKSLDIVKVSTAPRVVVLDYVASKIESLRR